MTGMDFSALKARYDDGDSPEELARELHAKCSEEPATFLATHALGHVLDQCSKINTIPAAERGPLWGSFFGVKDNIDVAGLPTTAACPAFSYTPDASAPVVDALIAAGAVCLGKTNMDQFAAGLNGTRSPYGVSRNAIDERVIPGGSSSGSASAVAGGCVNFALGTDTAGSGRVPAGLQGIVGVKPSVGLLSTKGVVPACGSIDCVSVFACNVSDGAAVCEVVRHADVPADDCTVTVRPDWVWPATSAAAGLPAFDFAVPSDALLDFSGPRGSKYEGFCRDAFKNAVKRLEALSGKAVSFDFAPLCETALMLYGTSFVAERYAGIVDFLTSGSYRNGPEGLSDVSEDDRLLPVTRAIVAGGSKFTAVDLYKDFEKLRMRKAAHFAALDAATPKGEAQPYLVVPTVMHHYLVTELQEQESASPPTWPYNSKLGKFTNFCNLLGLCAISIPTERLPEVSLESDDKALTLEFGITVIAPSGTDNALWRLAQAFEKAGP